MIYNIMVRRYYSIRYTSIELKQPLERFRKMVIVAEAIFFRQNRYRHDRRNRNS